MANTPIVEMTETDRQEFNKQNASKPAVIEPVPTPAQPATPAVEVEPIAEAPAFKAPELKPVQE